MFSEGRDDPAFAALAELLGEPDRASVVQLDDRDEPPQAEHIAGPVADRLGRLEGVAMSPRRQFERPADLDLRASADLEARTSLPIQRIDRKQARPSDQAAIAAPLDAELSEAILVEANRDPLDHRLDLVATQGIACADHPHDVGITERPSQPINVRWPETA